MERDPLVIYFSGKRGAERRRQGHGCEERQARTGVQKLKKIRPFPLLEQLQQFGKPTWHPYNFGKTRKNGLKQFGKPTW
jgi:hypothetical protein